MPDPVSFTLTRLELFPPGTVVTVHDTGLRLSSQAPLPSVPDPSIIPADQGRSLTQGGGRAPISPPVQTQTMGATGVTFSALIHGDRLRGSR